MERIGGLAFLVDERVRPHTAGQVLELVRSWRGEGFAIRPATGGCG